MVTVTAVAAVGVLADSCSGNEQPITWEDVAGTIPASVDYVVAVKTELAADSALADLWGGTDAGNLLREALAWNDTKPAHLVVVGLNGTNVVTWPLIDPEAAKDATGDWAEAELNGTTDARMKQTGSASIVVSATQAWVVDNRKGADKVNDLLSGAMSAPASHDDILRGVIAGTPGLAEGVLAVNDRYYRLGLEQRGDTAMALALTAVDKKDKAVPILDDMKPVPASRLTPKSTETPFVDIQVKRGDVPDLINRLTGVLPVGKETVALTMLGRLLTPASGTLTARLLPRDVNDPESSPRLEVSIPLRTKADAAEMAKTLKAMVDRGAPGAAEVSVDGTRVDVRAEVDASIADHLSQGRPLVLDPSVPSPSVVAHSGLDIDGRFFDVTLAANQMRATVVVGFERDKGFDSAVAFIGRLLRAAFGN